MLSSECRHHISECMCHISECLSRSFHTKSHDALATLGGIGTLVRIKRKMVTVTVGFNCQCDTPERSVSEGLSRLGWPVGVPVRDSLS